MSRPTILAVSALICLCGCDALSFGASGNEAAANAEPVNVSQATRAASAAPAPSDAGVTRSRSLEGLAGAGGKDPAAVQTGATGSIAPDWLVGRWTDNGDCKQVIEILADGSFISSSGGVGTWRVEDEALILSGAGGTFRLRLQSVLPGRIVTVAENGAVGQSTRC